MTRLTDGRPPGAHESRFAESLDLMHQRGWDFVAMKGSLYVFRRAPWWRRLYRRAEITARKLFIRR